MPIVEPAFGNIPIELVRPSATNPRKRFSEASLDELAKSIRQSGIGQPILVRPLANIESDVPDRVEIVAGERRYRASKLAGLTTIPAIVRDMSDAEVLEFQLVENLQREDVHPIEEAEGYERLMKEHKFTADECAEKVGKSRSYIYGRLKFCALSPEARTAFYDGALNASTALLVARIPVPLLQAQAAKEIVSWNGSADPMSYRAAVNHIHSRYMLELQSAPFEIWDGLLVPSAGTCGACPKRTGNQPELYKDIDSADVCTDPDCFSAKRSAQNEKILIAAQERNIPILEVSNIYEATQNNSNLISDEGRLWNFQRVRENNNRNIAEALPLDQRPEPTSYAKLKGGAVHPIYEKTAIQEALEKAGLCLTMDQYNESLKEQLSGAGRPEQTSAGKSTKEIEREAQLAELEQKVEIETSVRVGIYKAVRATASGGLGVELLRVIAKHLLIEYAFPEEQLHDLYDADISTDQALEKFIDDASIEEVGMLILDVVVGNDLMINRWSLENEDEEDVAPLLKAATNSVGIDFDQMRAEILAKTENQDAPPINDIDAADPAPITEMAIGDRVRVKENAKGPTGKKRKTCGKEGDLTAIFADDETGIHYTVKFGPKAHELVTNLTADELEKVSAPAEQEPAGSATTDADPEVVDSKKPKTREKPKTKAEIELADRTAVWPFPTGVRP